MHDSHIAPKDALEISKELQEACRLSVATEPARLDSLSLGTAHCERGNPSGQSITIAIT